MSDAKYHETIVRCQWRIKNTQELHTGKLWLRGDGSVFVKARETKLLKVMRCVPYVWGRGIHAQSYEIGRFEIALDGAAASALQSCIKASRSQAVTDGGTRCIPTA